MLGLKFLKKLVARAEEIEDLLADLDLFHAEEIEVREEILALPQEDAVVTFHVVRAHLPRNPPPHPSVTVIASFFLKTGV